MLAAPNPVGAASCCGGGSAMSPFVVPKQITMGWGLQISHLYEYDIRNADGEALRSNSWRNDTTRLELGGALRIHRDVQLGVAAGLRTDTMTYTYDAPSAHFLAGMSDTGISVRYELLDDETCYLVPPKELKWNEAKPSVHFIFSHTLPTAAWTLTNVRASAASVSLDADQITMLAVETSKAWGEMSTSLLVGAGAEYEIEYANVEHFQEVLLIAPAVQYFWDYRRYISLGWSYRHRFSDKSPDVDAILPSMSLAAQWYLDDAATLRIRPSVTTQGLIFGKNIAMGMSAGLVLMWEMPK